MALMSERELPDPDRVAAVLAARARRPPIAFSALCTGAAVGLALGAGYAAFFSAPPTFLQWWDATSRFLLVGLIFLAGALAVVALPTWLLAGRAGVTGPRRLVLLAAVALGAGVALGIVLGLRGWGGGFWVGVTVMATLWCGVPAGVLARPLSESRRLRRAVLAILALLTAAAAITVVL